MTEPRPDIQNWWAVEAMIASYNHVYQTIYNTRYEERGPIGISIYNDAPVASFHYEFLGLSSDLQAVSDAIAEYPIPEGKKHIVNIFHPAPNAPGLKEHFNELGMEFVRTAPILGVRLPQAVSTIPLHVHKATMLQHTEAANNNLTAEGERIHLQTLWDREIHNFYAKEAGQAVGWVQLVTRARGVGYLNQLYVMKDFRKRRLGTTLVNAAHAEALKVGVKRMVVVPSELSLPLFRRLGYRPLLFFSVFQPRPFRKFPKPLHEFQSNFSHTQI